ncbi:ribosomal protein S18-alanine N-acetyltransferase [Anaerocolumna sedimenticola]|uniref:[Ribosomal protein bS18]-alanine N-acetyltransferase n=1 Tax=Anaerocolumna sedimenticola TaxID=2696063 RepID=A0A6P1TIK6_9FIRM|nr:ribosomal protein S18-alanine N-acetyltransferase [Anaerocolumna sedimenticola]QHQ59922.1 ribosomal protein S18-alanine N-acetyltransferase [Anaerocolumna sedimenticola]
MLIREMQEKDLLRVHEMECSIFSKPWTVNDFKNSIQNRQNIYLVVEEEDQIIAYCGLWGVAGEGQINNVAVKKSLRGRGIGHAMLSALIGQGKKKGLGAFTLEVRVSNESAIALYHKLDFKDAGIRKNFYEEPTEDALIMWLQ